MTFFVSSSVADHNPTDTSKVPFNIKKPKHISPVPTFNHSDLMKKIECEGYIRAGFIQTDHDSATALGGEAGCSFKLNQLISIHAGAFASFDPGINSDNDDNIHTEFFNKKKDSYLIAGEAYLTLSYGNFNAHFGRQRLNSPFMDEDDLRIIPNLFEAYLIDYHLTDEIVIGSGYVREASGWATGTNASQFVSIGEALGGHSNGAVISWLDYDHDFLTSSTWFYYIPDHLTIVYTEFHFSQEITPSLSYDFGFQYNWGNDTGADRLGHINTHTFGVMAALAWSDVTLISAYNKSIGDTETLASIGGGPFFAALEDHSPDSVGENNSQGIMIGAEYNIIPEFAVGVMAGKFSTPNKSEYNKEELNFYLNFNWHDKILTEIMYAIVDDLNDEEDMHQFRVILTYQY